MPHTPNDSLDTRERAALVEPLRNRMAAALDAILDQAPLELLREAASAQSGAGSAAALVSRVAEAAPAVAMIDPEAAAVARLLGARQNLIATVPMLTSRQVATLLNITDAAVRKARLEGRLVGADYNGLRFPAFQFDVAAGRMRPMAPVIAALAAVPILGDWARIELLTASDADNSGLSIADLVVAGRGDEAVSVVRGYGEMGG
jgi:hypothetical protein